METNVAGGNAGQTSGNVVERTDSLVLDRTSEQVAAVHPRPRNQAEGLRTFRAIGNRDEAEAYAVQHLPRYFVENYKPMQRQLMKKRRQAKEYTPGYRQKPWKLPRALEQWKNNVVANEGGPSVLLLVGSPGAGKTQWAKSFGRPVEMNRGWEPDAFADGSTHLVMNDMNWVPSGPWAELLSCRESFEVKGRRGKKNKTFTFGKPVIVTCNIDNDPRKIRRVAALFRGELVVVVELGSREMLY
ncbi:hypothetical protein MCOR19_000643 [Pyricularia oryzae]|nr:hypothetical protein MCOR19_000643 [Pyricularia oryzae]KAI6456808.1 hypothetical protein MCOR15_007060 [Pyricularia oryzae]KAI6470815.1 hypothetical protein MCOR18_008918 [Pyricularia oryzae]KAI6516867.1 hypothetical protein MCOR16_009655 [Pyricularia oryzae]